jgi:uncharacterized protein with beta-barrel porin domain
MNQFLGIMLDPLVHGENGIGGVAGNAYAQLATGSAKPSFEKRWGIWSAGYGAGNSAKGDSAVGSTSIAAQTYGYAGGVDYAVTSTTIFGFALAGGGTSWNLSGGLGGGKGDAFQAGTYGITRAGPVYLAVALAFADHWMSTNRVALGDRLTANFLAQGYGARVEAGYRYAAVPALGISPFIALQAQNFRRLGYSEADVTGGGFGITYNAMNATDIRSELGARLDSPTMVGGMPLMLRARLAWAHDSVGDPSLGAMFESLPGASFVVNGAAMPKNSALTSAGADLSITTGLTLLAKFDGEFSHGSQTYAGSGTLRYKW